MSKARRVLPWVIPAAAFTVLAAFLLWEARPTWGWCVDGDGWGECATGRHDIIAIVSIAALVGVLVALTAVAFRPTSGRRRTALTGLCIALGVVAVLGLAASLDVIPVPLPQPSIPSGPSS